MNSVIVVLLVSVAVANAGFSGSLVQQVRPLLNQASIQTQLAVGGLRGKAATFNQLQTQLVVAIQQQAENVVAQISSAIETGQQIAQSIAAQLQQTFQHLQQLGSSFMQNAPQVLQNMLSNLLGQLGENRGFAQARLLIVDLELPQLLSQAIQQVFDGLLTPEQISALISAITGGVQSRGIISGLSELSNLLTTFLGIASSTAGNTHLAVSTLVRQFLATAISAGGAAVGAASNQLLNFLRPFRLILGNVYTEVEQTIANILGTTPLEI